MVAIRQVISRWTGFGGGPGLSVMYFSDLDGNVADVRAFWNELVTLLPDDVTITVDSSGDVIEDSTGALQGGWSETPAAAVIGTSAAAYAAAAGAIAHWNTNLIYRRRRVRGRTFIVPLSSIGFSTDGTLLNSALTTIQTAANNLVTNSAGQFRVWSRPNPLSEQAQGLSAVVQSALVPDKGMILTSRRD